MCPAALKLLKSYDIWPMRPRPSDTCCPSEGCDFMLACPTQFWPVSCTHIKRRVEVNGEIGLSSAITTLLLFCVCILSEKLQKETDIDISQ